MASAVGFYTHPGRPGRLSPDGNSQYQLVGCNSIYRCEITECGAITMLYLISPPWF